MSNQRNPSKSWPLILVVLNAIGAAAYVSLASNAWVLPHECEAGIHVTTGEPFVWFVSIAPVIVVFFFVNTAWGTMILMRRRLKAGRLWLAAAAIWVIAAVVDFSHHHC